MYVRSYAISPLQIVWMLIQCTSLSLRSSQPGMSCANGWGEALAGALSESPKLSLVQAQTFGTFSAASDSPSDGSEVLEDGACLTRIARY